MLYQPLITNFGAPTAAFPLRKPSYYMLHLRSEFYLSVLPSGMYALFNFHCRSLILLADAIMTVLISTPIQIFLARRIRIISQSIWVALAISILAVISLGKCTPYCSLRKIGMLMSHGTLTPVGGLWLGASVKRIAKHPQLHLPELRWPAVMWLVASALADIALTCSLVFYLVCGFDNIIDYDT
jgi:hypothetical protein